MTTEKRHLLVKGAILAILLALIFMFSRYGPQPLAFLMGEDLGEALTRGRKLERRLKKFLISFGPYSSAVFILLQAIQVVFSPIPGELVGVVGGYVYGKTFGFILSTVGLTLGSWLAFELASNLGRPFVETFANKEVLERFNFVTTKTGATICFLLFVVPGFPKDYLCYFLGLSRMNLSTFLIVSTLGRMLGTYFLTLMGANIRSQAYLAASIVAAISAAVLFLAYLHREWLLRWIKSKTEKKHSL
jgi:uncharacterized membrane protein YdjX (TVP38/TMEM64 family)